MSGKQVVLVVDFDCSTCSFCGLGAHYGDKRHSRALEMGSVRGEPGERACGRRFTNTASSAASTRMAAGIKVKYPDLPFLGSGEVVGSMGTECMFRLATPANKFRSK